MEKSMTDEQRKRIKAAATELSDAMTAASCRMDVEVERINAQLMSESEPRYIYVVHVTARHEEVIA